MDIALIFLTVLLFAGQTLFLKQFNLNYMRNFASYFIFNFIFCGIIAAGYTLTGPRLQSASSTTILLAAVFGVLFVTAVFIYTKAMELGPLSYTTLFFSGGLVVPVLTGILLFGERLRVLSFSGLILLAVSFYLGSTSGGKDNKKATWKWLFLCIVAMLSNGSLAAISKIHQKRLPGQELPEFMLIAFTTSAVLSLLLFLWYRLGRKQAIGHMAKPGLALIALGAAVTTGVGNQLIFLLAGHVSSIVLYPSVNGGLLLMSALLAWVIFREKLSRKGLVGFTAGLLSLVLLSM